MPTFAVLGSGGWGTAVALTLARKPGHRVRLWSARPETHRDLREQRENVRQLPGLPLPAELELTADPAAATAGADCWVVAVPTAFLRATARPGCVHVLMATVSVAFVEELVQMHREVGVGYVAAPVFGVPAAAAQAQLNVLVAGEPAAVAKAQPLLDLLGRKTWPLGDDPRRAHIAKIAGNLMISLAIEAMGEASALTESYGLASADFLDIVTNTLMASPSYQRYGGFIGSRQY